MLDHVAKHVEGSNTNKKYMRNEIWSLICAKGAPSWFITFAPTDLKHPLCLYLASEDIRFYPKMYAEDKRWSLIANNPVACARFFHFMVQAFIKHILGVGTNHDGLYGDTNGYYGTVEEQGRLTLHLHMMLWIKGSLTPQEIHHKLEQKDSQFQQAMIAYLESTHQGGYIDTTASDISVKIATTESEVKGTPNSTLTLPTAPPKDCSKHNELT